jgi:hypothetical protein
MIDKNESCFISEGIYLINMLFVRNRSLEWIILSSEGLFKIFTK